jgi:hypothetical protein
MSFISRFLKLKKQEEDVLAGIDETLAEGEEQGLLIPTGPQPGGPAEEGVLGNLDVVGPSGTLEGDESGQDEAEAATEVEDGELPTAAQDGADAADPADASVAEGTPETTELEVQTVSLKGEGSDATGDDLLSAFRDTTVTGQAHGLADGLEDVPAHELLVELREVRGYLPQAQTARDEGLGGEDG